MEEVDFIFILISTLILFSSFSPLSLLLSLPLSPLGLDQVEMMCQLLGSCQYDYISSS